MPNARKATVLISLLCYLVAVNVASAHGFPMLDQNDSMVSTMELVDDRLMPDCHSPKTPPCGQSESGSCQIFCSVMAQALTAMIDSSWLEIQLSVSHTPLNNTMLSRQLSVEPHPPK